MTRPNKGVELTRNYSEQAPGANEDPSLLSREERRKQYACGDRYLTIDRIPRWSRILEDSNKLPAGAAEDGLNERVCLYRGDITTLEIDAIVNAANERLMGGGGVDGSIHRAAGYQLKDACRSIGFCPTGKAVITKGFFLPADYIIHTVGPIGHYKQLLYSCYQECFDRMLENNLKTIAFCCISTGIYGFPNDDAARIALTVTRERLEQHPKNEIELVIFCCFLLKDVEIYERYMTKQFFPYMASSSSKSTNQRHRKNSSNRDRKESRSKSSENRRKTEENGNSAATTSKLTKCDENEVNNAAPTNSSDDLQKGNENENTTEQTQSQQKDGCNSSDNNCENVKSDEMLPHVNESVKEFFAKALTDDD